ncbi:NACHT domain-containing protein [Acinetobacter courvalinii]|uniref:NACHT domain-containing protein n=1 Tax=Acinetobacter courvalinii TaxID=280147 RepID=UPI0021D26960|nr:NACHT domain-containing protein [Acinetobacter courvalinii]MCU4578436.1 NACHT domain-containing protein [Acinetobacter courvalinii]
MADVITPLLLRTTAPTIFKEVTAFIKSKYSEHKALKQLSENNDDLVNSISKIMMVKTLASGADQPINLFNFFQKPKLKYSKGDQEFYIEHIDELPNHIEIDNYNNLIFQGTVGQGKSIFLRSLAIQDLIENKRIPIFLELKNISKNKDLMTLIKEYLQVWIGKEEEIFQLVLKSGKISIFLDAFDEINQELFDQTYADIDILIKSYPNLKVIVTTRPETSIIQNSNFYVLSLCPYTLEEQQGLIKRVIEDAEIQKTLITSIEASSFEVRKVLKTPLMVVLYIKQYQVGFSVPKHVTDFYKNIFDVVTFTHDRSKGIEKRKSFSSLNQDQLEQVFERLCFESFLLDKNVFDRPLFIKLLKRSLEKNNLPIVIDFNLLIDDFTRFACLILRDGTYFTFIHKSIQEYYVAKFISDRPEKSAEEIIKKKILFAEKNSKTVINFLEVTKPYFYKKYVFLESIKLYQEYFALSFINDTENYEKYLKHLSISTEISKDKTQIYLTSVYKIVPALDDFFVYYLSILADHAYTRGLVNERGYVRVSKNLFEQRPYEKKNDKLQPLLDVTSDLIFFEKVKEVWAEICFIVDKIKEEVRQDESSVLDDEFELDGI